MFNKSINKILLERQDEEYVKLIKEGDKDALEALYNRYKGLMYRLAFQFMIDHNLPNMHLVYLYDVVFDAFSDAIRDYAIGSKKSFLNFWWAIAVLRQKSYLRDLSKSLEMSVDPTEIDFPAVETNSDTITLKTELLKRVIKQANFLTPDEESLLKYLLLGFKTSEAAEFLNWSEAKAYRVKKKLFKKLNKIIKSN